MRRETFKNGRRTLRVSRLYSSAAERRFRKPQVESSNLSRGSILFLILRTDLGVILENLFEGHKQTTTMTSPKLSHATFAGGCFWCMVAPFENLTGVKAVVSGYAGGTKEDATYEQVSTGDTEHIEAVQVTYDATKTSYDELLDAFWRGIDPTDAEGQFADRGEQYKSAIYYGDEHEKKLAEASKKKLGASGMFDKPIATKILPFKTFFPAEEYHQDYHKKNPIRYKMYRMGSGRDAFLAETWAR